MLQFIASIAALFFAGVLILIFTTANRSSSDSQIATLEADNGINVPQSHSEAA
jgi:hypothetical protein